MREVWRIRWRVLGLELISGGCWLFVGSVGCLIIRLYSVSVCLPSCASEHVLKSLGRAAVILPRVQVHFNLSSKVVGLVSASTMAGVRP